MTKFQTSSNKSSSINFPSIRPSLDLDFANSKTLDPRITFTRSSSGSYVGPDGLIKYAGVNQPRFDHDPITGESLGLMIGEQRTNSVLQSENFATTWSTTRSSILSNVTTSPDGTVTADKLIGDTSSNQTHYVGQVFSFTSGTTYTYSVYVKAEEGNQIRIAGASETVWPGIITFDLKNGKILNTILGTGAIQSLGNGWYRCSVTATAVASLNTNILNYLSVNNNISFTGNGKNGIYIWGAQLEAGAFPTSYIPTLGSTRTRAADNVSMTGTNFSSWYNQTEGTVYSKSKITSYPLVTSTSTFWGIANNVGGINNNRISMQLSPSSYNYRPIIYINGTSVYGTNLTSTQSQYISWNSTTISYKRNDCITSINGKLNQKDNIVDIPSTNTFFINATNHSFLLSRFTYYPKRLSNSQLQALTK